MATDIHNSFTRLRDIDDCIFEEFQLYFPKLSSSIFVSTYPKTHPVALSFEISMNFIKNGIYDCIETDNQYSVKILFRSLIEHYLRFHLLWFNWCVSKDDSFAQQYTALSEAKEVIDTIKSEINGHKLYNNLEDVEQWKSLIKSHPKLIGKTEKEINDESAKFSIKNIIRFLNKELGEEYKTPLLQRIIVEYAKLSSYVHGGIGSHYAMIQYSNEEERTKDLVRIMELTTQITASVKLFTLIMIIQTDKDNFENHYHKINYLLNKI